VTEENQLVRLYIIYAIVMRFTWAGRIGVDLKNFSGEKTPIGVIGEDVEGGGPNGKP